MKARFSQLLSDQRVRFLLVGAANTALGYGIFVVLYLVMGALLPYLAVLVLAYFTASFFAFLAQRWVVFRVTGFFFLDLVRYLAVGLGVLGLNALFLVAGVEWLALPVLGAQALATFIAVVLSYLGHRFISFARSGRGDA